MSTVRHAVPSSRHTQYFSTCYRWSVTVYSQLNALSSFSAPTSQQAYIKPYAAQIWWSPSPRQNVCKSATFFRSGERENRHTKRQSPLKSPLGNWGIPHVQPWRNQSGGALIGFLLFLCLFCTGRAKRSAVWGKLQCMYLWCKVCIVHCVQWSIIN